MSNHPVTPANYPKDPYERRLAERRQTIAAFRTTANAQRTRAERIADGLATFFGSITFIALHILWFAVWIVWNGDVNGQPLIPGLVPFDPFPFGLLTMIVSLEAIFLSAFVLLSQNRSAEIADLRSELELQLNIVLEEKTTALIRAVHVLSNHMGVSDGLDSELLDLTQPLDLVAVEQATRAETMRRPPRAQMVDATVMRVRHALTLNNWEEAVQLIEAMKPADQADVFEELHIEQQAALLPRLQLEDSADILEEMEDAAAADVAERLKPEVLADILEEMEPDEAADVLGDLRPRDRAAALAAMEPDDVMEVTPLLIHPDESAGGLMTSEFLALRRRMTAAEALGVVRQWAPENEALYTLFVVDREGVLVGVLSLRTLVTAAPEAILQDIMDPDVVYVTVETPPDECSRLMAHYDLLALPVVDPGHKLLGVITVDDLLEEE
jgi:uncharacterized membrane protein/flagellar motility protein MotE (MotC chaperone)